MRTESSHGDCLDMLPRPAPLMVALPYDHEHDRCAVRRPGRVRLDVTGEVSDTFAVENSAGHHLAYVLRFHERQPHRTWWCCVCEQADCEYVRFAREALRERRSVS